MSSTAAIDSSADPPSFAKQMFSIHGAFSRQASALLDLFYPPRCEGCDVSLPSSREGTKRWLCEECQNKLQIIKPPFCSVCGEPFDGAITDEFVCGNCRDQKLHFDFAISAYMADGLVRHLIHRFKYQREIYLRGLLGSLLEQVLTDPRLQSVDRESWVLTPVPLHAWRLWRREFNQSWELCQVLSRITGIPAVNALSRSRATKSQARLSRHQRLLNLKSAFRMKRSALRKGAIQGKNVLLVDDVLTTGSTASECSRLLLREGQVEKVVVITVARG